VTSTETVGESELQRRLRRMIELRGVGAVSREIGLAREPVLRYLTGVDVQVVTRALIESKLSKLDDAPPAPPTLGPQ
jgi:hypothetical protein